MIFRARHVLTEIKTNIFAADSLAGNVQARIASDSLFSCLDRCMFAGVGLAFPFSGFFFVLAFLKLVGLKVMCTVTFAFFFNLFSCPLRRLFFVCLILAFLFLEGV